ncbi:MAG: transposase [Magnetococcus sp. DMHC-1]
MWCQDQEIKPRFLIRDADAKFFGPFNTVWKTEGSRVIQIPHCAPHANAFAESFIGTLKWECLDFFVCFSRSQLAFICTTWLRHYNTERPHRGAEMGNNVLDVKFKAARDGPIRSREALGGIIRSYYREAAQPFPKGLSHDTIALKYIMDLVLPYFGTPQENGTESTAA